MPWSLKVRGLGPHEATKIAIRHDGPTAILGPSEAGKSFLLEAFCTALWGCGSDGRPLPPEALRDGHDKAEVVLGTPKGGSIRRTATRGGSKARSIAMPGGEAVAHSSDEAMRKALGPLGDPRLRLAAVPLAWRELAEGNARPLRDFFASVLPPADLRAEVARLMGAAVLRPSDPTDEKGATASRAAANKARDEAAGRLSGARARLVESDAPPADAVDPEAEAAARETVQAAKTWQDHDAAWERWRDTVAARATALEALESWQKRRDALPALPDPEAVVAAADAQAKASEALRKTSAAVRDAARCLDAARGDRDMVASAPDAETVDALTACRQAEAAVEALPADEPCENCGAIPKSAAARRVAAVALAEEKHRAVDAARAGADERQAARLATAERTLAERQAEDDAARAAHAAQETVCAEADEALRALRERQREHAAAVKALGPEPTVQPEASEPPAPTVPKPAGQDVVNAQALLARAERERGAAAERARDRDRAEAAIERETAAHAAAVTEAARLDALVSAVRAAPSEVARRQAEALGDLGPVTLAWGDGTAQSPAVTVLCDGRPWYLASTGRQIVADLWLRATLRRCLGAPWLPLWVDRAQDVGGQDLPDVGGAVVLLRTTDEGPLRAE